MVIGSIEVQTSEVVEEGLALAMTKHVQCNVELDANLGEDYGMDAEANQASKKHVRSELVYISVVVRGQSGYWTRPMTSDWLGKGWCA